jgi:hypothetical protein
LQIRKLGEVGIDFACFREQPRREEAAFAGPQLPTRLRPQDARGGSVQSIDLAQIDFMIGRIAAAVGGVRPQKAVGEPLGEETQQR